ncbi:hypothetical protein PIB30_064881 [Stylosanthes scabra]|uniref:Putative plant transposon protein domain-containing protein n=1 Tax=Stylosanthes scabra TaxID=79078 RepID=A0ABU6SLU1_9FABA|nr:hypothetical protein [Stylosanthes scabra]
MASSSSTANMVDEHCFRALFNQNLFEEIVRRKKVTPEVSFDLENEEYLAIREHITLGGWRRLASLRTKISKLLIQEFYANAVQTDEEMEQAEQHLYKSYVRGVEVDFSPENIRRVLRFKEHTPEAETNYATRQRTDQRLDEVLTDLCIPGATWRLSSGQPAQPIQLRRAELTPLARGWHEFIIHSIIPTGNNKSYIDSFNHKGEDVRVEELIADNITVIAQGMQGKGKLAFENMQNTQAEYLEELKTVKARQDELWNNTNKFHHQIRKVQDMIAREIQEVKKFQVNQALMGFRTEAVEKA